MTPRSAPQGLISKFFSELGEFGLGHVIGRVRAHVAGRRYVRSLDAVDRRRVELAKSLDAQLGGVVRYGPFKGLKFSKDASWSGADRANMLFGLYEQEVLRSLLDVPAAYTTFIDLGAADGYYGIGVLASGLFEKSYCFEMTEKGRRMIAANAALNGVADRVTILGTAEPDFHRQLPDAELARSVLFIDVEGAEFSLLSRPVLEAFSRSIVFIELHDWFFEDGAQRLERLRRAAADLFDLSELKTTGRDLSAFPELARYSDNDRWLICSEGRAQLMTWLRLDPKARAAGVSASAAKSAR